MAVVQKPFHSPYGFSANGIDQLSGAGVPGSTTATNNALVGSSYLDSTNGQIYVKRTSGSGTDKWKKIVSQDALDAAQLGQSWLEPALVRDNTLRADVAAAQTAANVANTVDGVTIVSGSRILLDNFTSGSERVYIVSGSTGAWTFTAEGNTETKGDAVFVQDGTDAGKQFAYNGTTWVQQGGAASTEVGYIQTFVGKTADGSETPTYSSENVVSTGDSLETATGKLDAEIGGAVSTAQSRTAGPISDQAVNLNIEAVDDAIGPNVTSTNVAVAASSVNVNVGLLDAEIGAAVATAQSRTAGLISDQAINLNVEALDDAIGADVTSTEIVAAASTVNANISALDVVVAAARKVSTSSAVTTAATVDSVVVDDAFVVMWLVYAQSVGTPANTYASRVMAVHDGSVGTDAVNMDYTISASLYPNTLPTDLTFTVDLSGAAGSQVMRLRCSSTDSVNVRATRMTL